MKYHLDFFTQYGQFYIADRDSDGDDTGTDFWDESAFINRLAISDGVLGVAIENDECSAKVEITVLESSPYTADFKEVDHVVEGSLKVSSGRLQIQDCPTGTVALEIALDPGEYRCRIYSYDLDKAYQDEPQDYYKIEIWKESLQDIKVLKQWASSY